MNRQHVLRHIAGMLAAIVMLTVLLMVEQGPSSIAYADPIIDPLYPEQRKQVAIVIDDFGNKMEGTEQILQLPVKITIAVMPFMPSSKADAEAAHRMGHDVIVHMPMEPKKGNPSWLGPGAIMANQSDQEIEDRVRRAIDDIPFAVGMNNHMGSKVTGDKRIMRIVLKVCKEKGLFFLDSRTNYRSVTNEIGKELGVPVMNNHLFLDDEITDSHVSKQWSKVEQLLEKQSPFVVIGHVGTGGKNTSSVLHRVIPNAKEHIQFVRASELMDNPPPPMYTQ